MKRILTAIIALPILLYTVWSDSPYFFVAIASIAILLALHEFYNIASKTSGRPFAVCGYIAALCVVACFVFTFFTSLVAVMVALTIVSLPSALSRPEEINKSLASVAATVFGVIYVALLAGFLIGVRMMFIKESTLIMPHPAAKLLPVFFA